MGALDFIILDKPWVSDRLGSDGTVCIDRSAVFKEAFNDVAFLGCE